MIYIHIVVQLLDDTEDGAQTYVHFVVHVLFATNDQAMQYTHCGT
jgi:hypothetical protein